MNFKEDYDGTYVRYSVTSEHGIDIAFYGYPPEVDGETVTIIWVDFDSGTMRAEDIAPDGSDAKGTYFVIDGLILSIFDIHSKLEHWLIECENEEYSNRDM